MKKFVTSILVVFLSGLSLMAQDIPEKPAKERLVNDFANVLNDNQERQLESELVQFSNQTSTQILVVTVPSLDGHDASDYAFQLGEKWGIGKKGEDNGVVVLFKPKTQSERGQVFVAVGYGLEEVIPDAVANRDIVNMEMIPRFKNGDIFGGLYHGTHVIMDLAQGVYSAEQYHQAANDQQGDSVLGGIAFFLIIFIVIPIIMSRKRKGQYSSRGSLPFWIAMGMMNSGRHSGSWNNFSGGGGSFGGGGFGGFGGGSFGGGGAGGSW